MTDKILSLEEENKVKEMALNTMFYIITFIPLMLFNGWCLSLLYIWWLLPITNISLTIIQCAGICMVISFVKTKFIYKKTKDKNEYGFWATMCMVIINKLIVIGVNYIVWLVLV